MRALLRYSARGFTLIELIVALLIGTIGVAAAFGLARGLVRGYADESELARVQNSAELILEAVALDIRNAGFGTSFYAGLPTTAFGGQVAVTDATGQSRGFPALRIANNAVSTGVIMPGSDAVLLLRITSSPAYLQTTVPCAPGIGTVYALAPNSGSALTSCRSGLVLLSDATRPSSEPESMILAVDPNVTGDVIAFRDAFGINPADAARCTDGSVPPKGVGGGSLAVCIQPVTYWVDARARLRAWQPTAATAVAPITLRGPVYDGRVPIDPNRDRVLLEGVEDLQIAVRMSHAATTAVRDNWAFARPGPPEPATSYVPASEDELAEARVARISVLLRTMRAQGSRQAGREGLLAPGARNEDHALPTTQQFGCATDAENCYDPSYVRRLFVSEAELRNMRLFDLIADPDTTFDQLRSYRP